MSRHDITQRRLDAADDIALWYEALVEMAARARRDGDGAMELLALDAGEGLLALADHLLFGERARRPVLEPTPSRGLEV